MTFLPTRFRLSALLAPCLMLAGCGYSASRLTHEAQISMIGMTENDLDACAGPPDKTTILNPASRVLTYEYRPAGTGGLSLQLPLSLGGVSLGGEGTYCRADFRIVDHRVTELHYTGDDDKTIGQDGVCAPLVSGCMRQPEPTMGLVGGASEDRASAFHAPAVPAQPAGAEETAAGPGSAGK